MANNEIHNYQTERTNPEGTDWLDVDADEGSFESQKLSLNTLRNWLLKSVYQPTINLLIFGGQTTLNLTDSNHFDLLLDEDITLNFQDEPPTSFRGTYVINCTQDSLGGHTITNGVNIIDVDGIAEPKTGGNEQFQIWLYWNGSKLIKNVVNL